jgi:hypothetical protein
MMPTKTQPSAEDGTGLRRGPQAGLEMKRRVKVATGGTAQYPGRVA